MLHSKECLSLSLTTAYISWQGRKYKEIVTVLLLADSNKDIFFWVDKKSRFILLQPAILNVIIRKPYISLRTQLIKFIMFLHAKKNFPVKFLARITLHTPIHTEHPALSAKSIIQPEIKRLIRVVLDKIRIARELAAVKTLPQKITC